MFSNSLTLIQPDDPSVVCLGYQAVSFIGPLLSGPAVTGRWCPRHLTRVASEVSLREAASKRVTATRRLPGVKCAPLPQGRQSEHSAVRTYTLVTWP